MRQIADLSDAKTKLEQDFYAVKNKLADSNNRLDQAKEDILTAHKLKEKLLTEHKDQKSQSLVEMSKELQAARLEGFRLNRKNKELDERCSYLQKVIKDTEDRIVALEQSETQAKGDLVRVKEEYAEKDNARIRFFESVRKGQRAAGNQLGRDPKTHVKDKLADAADLSATKNVHLKTDVKDRVRRQQSLA